MINEIETEEDYRDALHRFLEICEAPKNETEVGELFQLILLLEDYEQKNCRYD